MDDMVKDIQGLIQIKSVEAPAEGNMPFGRGVQDALEYTLKLGQDMGFTVKTWITTVAILSLARAKNLSAF